MSIYGLEIKLVSIFTQVMKITIKNLPFLFIDLVAFYLALLVSLAIRLGSGFSFEILNFHFRAFLAPLLFLIVIFFVLGLYELRNLFKLLGYLRLLMTGLVVFFIIATIYFYFFPTANISPKTILVLLTLTLGVADFTLPAYIASKRSM